MSKAADNIEAKSRSLKDVLFEKHYKVGYFQREYKWKRTHIEDLIVDLERSFNTNWDKAHKQSEVASYSKYYMGPIVIFMDKSEYSIVDGQQRLTSFVLLMIFINKQFHRILNIKNKFKGYIFSEHYGTESYNMNIVDRKSMLDYLFLGKEYDEQILKNESCKTILERYNDICELFPPSLLNAEVLPLFANWLTEKLVFIEILTQTSESAYTIFETMNDRGLNLTQTELLKSYLLSNVKDEQKIKELDSIWKISISNLNIIDDDQDFFKAWFRAKYAISIRTSEKETDNKDFEKIGTRFSSWAQENTKTNKDHDSKLLLDNKDPDTFYYFVKSDFCFFCDIYLKLKKYELNGNIPEHRIKLMSYKGISPSLSYPLILSPILKTDAENIINEKIEISVNYLDSLATYRMLINEPITHSSIRNSIYVKIRDIRNFDINNLREKFQKEILEYRKEFRSFDYLTLNSNSRYILSRLLLLRNQNMEFENIYFQRRKESYILYQFLKVEDFDTEKMGLPKGLKDRMLNCMCSTTLVPRYLYQECEKLSFVNRLEKLISEKYIQEFNKINEIDFDNLKNFFINRERMLKEQILTYWNL